MASLEELIPKAKNAIKEFDEDAAKEVAQEGIDSNVDLVKLIEDGFTAAMTEVGDQFEEGSLFLPHVIAASEAMSAAVELITPVLEEQRGGAEEKHGGVVIGTIAGDIHTIGKDIVATMLKIAGFELYDLGRDVAIESYVNKAKEVDADIVASSALMTPTMTEQLTLEEQLKEAGIRDKVKTMIGGAPVSQKWADEIGADIYAENAADAVKKAKEAVK
ncbi:methyltransferase cognate corrinoid protein [Methanohalobium evestigatum Z-7303]|uniref:Methyltransferase cognate corrinoid protein n=1 Tax=Methanohalobium evestigatum (strain ATCC BAA-1072 / DSM 3721 / NBRC 107634 / OCM 161 / Z-7303) TaxID=644295 RepID=D7EAA9_METEZ|nr:B12-binding domain-containing protein [Methanohalobium evestigatum]ADI74780.1 methyltransferase cognate corrinoid protein [Methanohalobium evestigatum Z-7303]